jgi:toxin secretion/phage lysis holin
MQQQDLGLFLGGYLREMAAHFPEKLTLSGLAGFIGALMGGTGAAVNVLVMLMTVDFVLGFWRACRLQAVSASKLKAGCLKYVFYGLSIIVMAGVDFVVGQNVPVKLPLRDLFVAYLCISEGLSALEHLAFFGVPVPSKLRSALREYRDTICPPVKAVAKESDQ